MPLAIITGQSRGLGSALSIAFKAADYSVPRCTREEVDVRDADQVWTFAYGLDRVDVLINNAAVLGPVGPVETNGEIGWADTIAVNLLGAAHMTQAVLPIMKRQGWGKIINIAGGGATGPLPRRSAYAASKAALVRFTECVAAEVENTGISVNAVLPGPMPTDMFAEIVAAGPEALGDAEYAEHSELKDEGAVERAVELCLWLASAESAGLSGRTISARFDAWPFDEEKQAQIMASDRFTLRRMT